MLDLATCRIDLTRGVVHHPSGDVVLTTRESELLVYLSKRPLAAISREELLTEVWGYSDAVVTRACDNTIRRLREKIEVDPKNPRHVLTVHGTGYRFVPVDDSSSLVAEPQPSVLAPAPRSGNEPVSVAFDIGHCHIDLSKGLLESDAGKVALTGKEIALLQCLYDARGAVVERQTLVRATGGEAGLRAIDNLVGRLRRKLEVDPTTPCVLLTAAGGYRLETGVPTAQSQGAPLGRASLLAEIRRTMSAAPFAVLHGPMGVGKTLLATHWARENQAVWVDLREATSADQVALRVVHALGLGLGDREPADRIEVALSGTSFHVVLDNLDAVATVTAQLVERWTRSGPRSRFLATSQVLGTLQHSDVPCIEVPPLAAAHSIALFLQQMRRRRPEEPEIDVEIVRQIVERLDHLPLAIALAASRTSVLSVQSLLERLSLKLLVDPRAQGRHASLPRTIAASVELLDPEERGALRLLAIPTRFDIDDAEVMLGPSAIDLIQSLRDRSLLREEPMSAGTASLTFSAWQSVRSFMSKERAALADQGRACAERFVEAFASFADRGETGVPSAYRRESMRLHLDDMATAVTLGLSFSLPRAARCAIGAGFWYCWFGPASAGISLVERALTLPNIDPADQRMLLFILGQLELNASSLHSAKETLERAIELAGDSDPWVAIRARAMLANVLQSLGANGDASEQLAQGAAMATSSGDRAYASLLRAKSAHAAGDFPAALAAYEACRDEATDARDVANHGHIGLGLVATRLGKLSVALEHLTLVLDRWEGVDRSGWLGVMSHVSYVLALLGDRDSLETLVERGRTEAHRDGWFYEEAMFSAYLGSCRLFAQDLDGARASLGTARGILERLSSYPPAALAYLETRSSDLALAQGEPAVASAYAERAERIAATSQSLTAMLYSSHSAAMAALALGDLRGAVERLDSAVVKLPELSSRYDLGVQRARWAVIAEQLGRGDDAATWLAEAEAQIPWTGVWPTSELLWWSRSVKTIEQRRKTLRIA